MKKLLIALFALVLTFALVLPVAGLGETANGTAEDAANEGTYDGEYDASGKRSGYGTWEYHNFQYVGNWENDLPNGEGTLYAHEAYESDGRTLIEKRIVQGNWVDGFAEGVIEESYIDSSGHVTTYRLDVKNGRTTSDEPTTSIDGRSTMGLGIGSLEGAVPPRAGGWTDSSIPRHHPHLSTMQTCLRSPV